MSLWLSIPSVVVDIIDAYALDGIVIHIKGSGRRPDNLDKEHETHGKLE